MRVDLASGPVSIVHIEAKNDGIFFLTITSESAKLGG